MKIYHVESVNLDISEKPIDCGYYTNYALAKEFALKDITTKNGKDIQFLPKGTREYNGTSLDYTRKTYHDGYVYRSHYGNYRCARIIKTIIVQNKLQSDEPEQSDPTSYQYGE